MGTPASHINEAVDRELDQFSQHVRDSHDHVRDFRLYSRGDDIHLDRVEVEPSQRKKGIGSSVMKKLIQHADSRGKRITLDLADKGDPGGTTSRGRLSKFYKAHGFVDNKGRNKDYRTSASMYRRPEAASRAGLIGVKEDYNADSLILSLLNESYINLFPEHKDERRLMAKEVFTHLAKSYEGIGGLASAGMQNPEQLVASDTHWKLKRSDGRITAGVIYKRKGGYRKGVAFFSDGTDQGKGHLEDIVKSEINLRRSKGELSGPLLGFTKKVVGTKAFKKAAVPRQRVQAHLAGKAIRLLPDNPITKKYPDLLKYAYSREIGDQPRAKVLIGRGFPKDKGDWYKKESLFGSTASSLIETKLDEAFSGPKTNRYPGKCDHCEIKVPVSKGRLMRYIGSKKSTLYCPSCERDVSSLQYVGQNQSRWSRKNAYSKDSVRLRDLRQRMQDKKGSNAGKTLGE